MTSSNVSSGFSFFHRNLDYTAIARRGFSLTALAFGCMFGTSLAGETLQQFGGQQAWVCSPPVALFAQLVWSSTYRMSTPHKAKNVFVVRRHI